MSFIKNPDTNGQSDAELVLLFKQNGDMEVLGQLYQRYMELVYGVCLKYLKDAEIARDAVMQVFEELGPKLKRHQVDNFRGWLYQVAKNHCLMQLRTPKNLKTVSLDGNLVQNEESVHLNGVLEKEENLLKMEACLETLTADQKKMISLFYLEGKCYNEIVEITGEEWNKVRSHIQNGRRNLKICMEKQAEITPENLRTGTR